MFDFCVSKVAYLHELLVPSLQVVSNLNTVPITGYLLFHYWSPVNQEPAIIEGKVNTRLLH